MRAQQLKQKQAWRRKNSVRNRIRRTSDLPRLSVNRTLKHIYAQVIDDSQGRTLCAVGTTGKAFSADLAGKTKTEVADAVGREIAKRALDAGIQKVAFDRGASRYIGRVKALADAAREAGLKF